MEMEQIIRSGGFACFDGEVLRITQDETVPYAVVDPQRLAVEVAEGVQAQLVLLHTSANQSTVRVALAEGAALDVTEVFTAEAFVEFNVRQATRSHCTVTMAQLTSANVTYGFDLDGADAECDLGGVFLAAGHEHCEVAARIGHNVADCRSHSLVKGVAGDAATGEFCGLVFVAPDAQRTDARQQSRNLLMSREARILTRPQLEIYADDVKCTHGATVGQMDSDAIFYMRQRGLGEAQARALVIEGFVDDVVRRMSVEPLREELLAAVSRKLEKMEYV